MKIEVERGSLIEILRLLLGKTDIDHIDIKLKPSKSIKEPKLKDSE